MLRVYGGTHSWMGWQPAVLGYAPVQRYRTWNYRAGAGVGTDVQNGTDGSDGLQDDATLRCSKAPERDGMPHLLSTAYHRHRHGMTSCINQIVLHDHRQATLAWAVRQRADPCAAASLPWLTHRSSEIFDPITSTSRPVTAPGRTEARAGQLSPVKSPLRKPR